MFSPPTQNDENLAKTDQVVYGRCKCFHKKTCIVLDWVRSPPPNEKGDLPSGGMLDLEICGIR